MKTLIIILCMLSWFTAKAQTTKNDSLFYKQAWKNVDSLSKKNLTKSAQAEVNKILEKARNEHHNSQYIKSVAYHLKYAQMMNRRYISKTIREMENEIQKTDTQNVPLMKSMLAELYWWYYCENYRRFQNRTETVKFKNDSIETWDLPHLVDKTIKLHQEALQKATQLQQIPIEQYKDILILGTKPALLRPTLYDFLAHRAIDFFSDSKITLTQPADQFVLFDSLYFSDTQSFAYQNIQSQDTLSLQFNAIRIFQDLLKFRLQSDNYPALIDADLKRLDFVRTYSTNPNKEELYLKALENLLMRFDSKTDSVSEIKYRIAKWYFDTSKNYNPIAKETEKYKFYKVKSYQLCNEIHTQYPHSSAAIWAGDIQKVINEKHLSFEYEKNIPPNEKTFIKVSYQNVDTLYLKVLSLNKTIMNDFFYCGEHSYSFGDDYEDFIKTATTVQNQTIIVPVDKDYNCHSIEVPINERSIGLYYLLVSDNNDFKREENRHLHDWQNVTNLSYILQRPEYHNFKLYVLDRKTGKSISNAKLLKYIDSCVIYPFKSNRKGEINVGLNKQKKESFLFFIMKQMDCVTNLGENYCLYPKEKKDSWRKVLKETYKEWKRSNDDFHDFIEKFKEIWEYRNNENVYKYIVWYTDRAIYRPGQTVYFKGICLKQVDDQTTLETKKPVSIKFRDMNDKYIDELNLVSNQYGTFSGSFQIPKGLRNGKMSISTYSDITTISVEEYKRPQFEVKMLPFDANYRINDTVIVKACAKAFSGANLSQAKVKYRIVRSPIWNGWWEYSYDKTSTQMACGNTNSNKKGEFELRFKALPDLTLTPSEYLNFTYQIFLDVTDLNGETQSGKGTLTVGKNALSIDLNLQKLVQKNDTSLKHVSILTKNLNNQFLAAKGTLQISKLKDLDQALRPRYWTHSDKRFCSYAQWQKMFPNDSYDNEDDISNLSKEKSIVQMTFNTAQQKEIDLSQMKNWESGRYLIEMQAKDTFNNTISTTKYITLFSQKDKTPAYKTTCWIESLTPTCEVGETAQFLIATSESKVHILCEVEHEGKIVNRKWLTLTNEQSIFKVKVKEKYRGNFGVHFTFVKNNRFYTSNHTVTVPYTNKELEIRFETFRNKLVAGENEEWKISIRDKKGRNVKAEMLATLYDASLDKFKPNSFHLDLTYWYSPYWNWKTDNFKSENRCAWYSESNPLRRDSRIYTKLNWFGFQSESGLRIRDMDRSYYEGGLAISGLEEHKQKKQIKKDTLKPESNLENVLLRKNFNETAFFYPHLESNSKGEITINFTIPESLTRWKMLGFAHTKDLKYGFIQNELVTQKDLMVVPNVPRFFRENDSIMFPVKITNLSDKNLNGIIQLEMFDATTSKKVLNFDNQTFSINAGLNTVANWKFKVPENVGAIKYRIIAKAGNFTDGEERIIPVLANRMLVTESMPLPIRGHQTKTFELKKLIHSDTSNTLKHHKLSLEFTSQPAWYAIQSLPYLMEYPHECAEQLFSRFYANSLASHVANSSPKIKAVFDSWKSSPDSSALLSNLEKNQELKSAILEETPWVLDAQNESERKKRVGLLFDLNRMSTQLDNAFSKLQKMQKSNGSFPWFDGMADNRYLTQHIVAGIGKLERLTIVENEAQSMQYKAIKYLDKCLKTDYDTLKQRKLLERNNLTYTAIHYLYARSFSDYPITYEEIFKYYKSQCEKYWTSQGNYAQAMIALYLYRAGNKSVANDIVKSLKEHAQNSDEMGMYWENESGYYWYQAPIETQAMLIEAFDEIAKDSASVDNMRVWLLKQKQTQNWQTTKATTEAVYALLLKGTNWLASDKLVSINIGGKDFTPEKTEAGTGYFKTSWKGSDIKPEMGKITVSKSDDGIAWGALYWEYFEQLDKITPHESPLKLNKKLFVERITNRGTVIEPINEKTKLIVGDKVIVRIELRVDRTMEYVHLKDMRASGFEPLNVFSQYKYQDGLGYYECTKDAATNFFMDWLPKGTYVFEYPLRVTHSGDFSNGISTIQSMYAPEFSSHSEGIRIKIEK